jgi:glycosyltransferase involved in cell wall biosynthesis
MNKKKVAFIFALPLRTRPILITMPFGLNIIQLLDKKDYKIDVFLSEYRNESYQNIFSKNVTIHFIDQNYLWRNKVSLAYFMVTKYFKLKSFFKFRNRYELIFGTGMAGITLAAILKQNNNKSKFIYLNDEFPINDQKTIWVESEISSALKADLVVTPDESRFVPLCKQIPGLEKIANFTLPNTPLINDIDSVPIIDWHKYLGISKNKKLFLAAGGINDTYLISDLLESLNKWPKDAILILKSKNKINDLNRSFNQLNLKDKVICVNESYSLDKLHSLIKYCTASICLYKNKGDNIYYMGKSSGKIMRSIALGKPVISSDFPSLKYIELLKIGKLVYTSTQIVEAVEYILENEEKLIANCLEKYPLIGFEKYWEKFEKNIY